MTALSVEQSCPPRTSIKLVVALLNLISHPRRRGPLHRQAPSQWLGSPESGGPGAWDPVRHAASGRWAAAAPSDSESRAVHWHCGGTELPRSCPAPGPFEARLQAEADAAGAPAPQPALADPAGKPEAPTCWPVESRRPGHTCPGTIGRTRTDPCDGSDVREPANTFCRPMESHRHTRTHMPNAAKNYARKRDCG